MEHRLEGGSATAIHATLVVHQDRRGAGYHIVRVNRVDGKVVHAGGFGVGANDPDGSVATRRPKPVASLQLCGSNPRLRCLVPEAVVLRRVQDRYAPARVNHRYVGQISVDMEVHGNDRLACGLASLRIGCDIRVFHSNGTDWVGCAVAHENLCRSVKAAKSRTDAGFRTDSGTCPWIVRQQGFNVTTAVG